MILAFIQGFGTGGGLIVAIGAQNAFVLSEGVRGKYHIPIALICIICDALFISLGIAGIGATIAAHPSIGQWVAWGGAAFLFFYGFSSLRSAICGGHLEESAHGVQSLKTAVLMTLGVTLLNPHFYLDTVILLGSISSQFSNQHRLLFWAGAVSASTIWFLSLSFGSRILAPVFQRPISWRILDTVIWLTMWTIAVSLLYNNTQ